MNDYQVAYIDALVKRGATVRITGTTIGADIGGLENTQAKRKLRGDPAKASKQAWAVCSNLRAALRHL